MYGFYARDVSSGGKDSVRVCVQYHNNDDDSKGRSMLACCQVYYMIIYTVRRSFKGEK